MTGKKSGSKPGYHRPTSPPLAGRNYPKIRDLRMHEHVGGNVAVEWNDAPFTLEATFRTGADKSGEPRTITVENLTCTSN